MINQFSPKVSEVLSYSREEAERLLEPLCRTRTHYARHLKRERGAVSNMFGTLNLNLENIKSQLEERIKAKTKAN